MSPEFNHDERARYNFLSNLNRFVSTVIAPGNKIAYDKRVEPGFRKENNRTFSNRHEVASAMSKDPLYQMWGSLRRSTMEMRQQNGRATVLRQAATLAEKVKAATGSGENLFLKENFVVPPYLMHVDNHLMPGSYHKEYFIGDLANAANYDSGLFVTSGGMLGSLTDGGGKAIAA